MYDRHVGGLRRGGYTIHLILSLLHTTTCMRVRAPVMVMMVAVEMSRKSGPEWRGSRWGESRSYENLRRRLLHFLSSSSLNITSDSPSLASITLITRLITTKAHRKYVQKGILRHLQYVLPQPLHTRTHTLTYHQTSRPGGVAARTSPWSWIRFLKMSAASASPRSRETARPTRPRPRTHD